MCKYVGNKKVQNGYSTWDPRKNKTGEVPQYDEIPYGDVGPPGVGPQAQAQGFVDGHSGKGQLPQVPAEYSQVPNIPQRQGTLSYMTADCHNIGRGDDREMFYTRGQKTATFDRLASFFFPWKKLAVSLY